MNIDTYFATRLSPFGLDFNEFVNILKSTRAYVAGGFALSVALGTEKGKFVDWDQDLDIWVQAEKTTLSPGGMSKDNDFETDVLKPLIFKYYLKSNGYENIYRDETEKMLAMSKNRYENPELPYLNPVNGLHNSIDSIVTYIHKDTKKKIQVITTYALSPEENLKSFDLTCCRWYIDPSKYVDPNKYPPYPEKCRCILKFVGTDEEQADVLDMKAQWNNTLTDMREDRKKARVEKYKARGFTITSTSVL
jgi:hypothetical protein